MQQQLPFSDSKDSSGIKRLFHSVFSKDYGINTENLPTKPFIPFPFENLLNHAVCGLRESYYGLMYLCLTWVPGKYTASCIYYYIYLHLVIKQMA